MWPGLVLRYIKENWWCQAKLGGADLTLDVSPHLHSLCWSFPLLLMELLSSFLTPIPTTKPMRLRCRVSNALIHTKVVMTQYATLPQSDVIFKEERVMLNLTTDCLVCLM